jgi:uncharacterized membrane protein
MQDELHVLQPQLIETSEITEKLMVKIEQDTVVVEAKKEVSLLLCMRLGVLYVVCKFSVLWKMNNIEMLYFIFPSIALFTMTDFSPFFHFTP